MRVKELNEKLRTLYASKFPELAKAINEYNQQVIDTSQNQDDLLNRATNPFMLKVNEEWLNAGLRVMIFGQENLTWGGEFTEKGDAVFCEKMDEVIQLYEDKYLEGEMFNRRGPFWNMLKRIKNEVSKKGVALLWNNVLKIGRLKCGNVEAINEITYNCFNVVQEEIEYLKPNILVFFTGPRYDKHIKTFLGDFEVNNISGFDNVKQLCTVDFKNAKFKEQYEMKVALKTYHPQYLRRRGWEDLITHKIITELGNY